MYLAADLYQALDLVQAPVLAVDADLYLIQDPDIDLAVDLALDRVQDPNHGANTVI